MLGITVDDKMKLERHIANVCRKVSQQITVLSESKRSFHLKQESVYTYCSETKERACPPFVFNEKQTPYCELRDKIGLPSLANQRLAKIVCTVFKVVNSDHVTSSIVLSFGNIVTI